MKTIPEQLLPRDLKQDLCLSLLEEAGAERISIREDRGEIIHCCLMPWHNESNPSASINFDKLTYKCLGCQTSGGFIWLVATLKGIDTGEARNWLSGYSGIGGTEFQLQPLLDFLDALEEQASQGTYRPQPPKYSPKVLEPWNYICPVLTTGAPDLGITGRGIPEENLRKAQVGWDMDENRVIIPCFDHGELLGWQSRRLMSDGTPKYKSTPDFPRDTHILGLPEDKSRVIVVESPMSYLRHLHHAPVAATWGSTVTDFQIQQLKWFREVTFWPDPDMSGWRTVEGWFDDQGSYHPGAAQKLEPYTKVTVIDSDWFADPAEIDDEEFERLDAERLPLSIWQRPSGILRCIQCKERHTGICQGSPVVLADQAAGRG